MPRLRALSVAALAVLSACSGGTDEPGPADPSPSTVPGPVSDEPASALSDDSSLGVEDEAAPQVVEQWSVTIDAATEGFDGPSLDVSIGWTGDPDDVVAGGPFGHFASCSGLRDDVAAYSVFVSGSDAAEVIGVWTADRVTGSGIYDAEVRIERAGADPLTAAGTMTILDGFQQGSFLAFGPEGGRVEGTFSCSGTEPGRPLRVAPGAVEAFAVLRDGDAERIVGLATDDADVARCDVDGDPILSVTGDATIGAITAIQLGGGPDGVATLRIAGNDYEFVDLDVQLGPPAAPSGVFSAESVDGVSVDGAFRCG